MSQTVLQLDNVEFRRNRRVIITDVNLTIHAGERWVLFGPNGIGKSTAVGMLATRTFPSEGRVFILGHQLGKYDVFKLRTRIGLASADLGRQFPEFEDPLDAVVTGLSAVTGRWRDTYTQEEYARARQLLSGAIERSARRSCTLPTAALTSTTATITAASPCSPSASASSAATSSR